MILFSSDLEIPFQLDQSAFSHVVFLYSVEIRCDIKVILELLILIHHTSLFCVNKKWSELLVDAAAGDAWGEDPAPPWKR